MPWDDTNAALLFLESLVQRESLEALCFIFGGACRSQGDDDDDGDDDDGDDDDDDDDEDGIKCSLL